MKSYRALISVPIQAENDEAAEELAAEHARSLLHPGSAVIAGHVERLAEVQPGGGLTSGRVVMEADGFWTQLL